MTNGYVLNLETEGQGTEQNQVKQKFVAEWVNAYGGFGRWRWDVVFQPGALTEVLIRHTQAV